MEFLKLYLKLILVLHVHVDIDLYNFIKESNKAGERGGGVGINANLFFLNFTSVSNFLIMQ